MWHHVIKIVQDNQYYITYTVLFGDRSCVLLKQMCWFWHDFAWNQLRLSLSNVQSWWNIPCLFFSSLDFFTDSIGISAKFMQVVCSINAYEPLWRSKQTELPGVTNICLWKARDLANIAIGIGKGKLTLVLMQFFFPVQMTIGWIGVKTESVAKQRNYRKEKCFRKERKGL